jgi:hypothetical protein
VIYEVSMATVIEQTLQAPPLWAHARRLRELTRDHVAAAGGSFGISRQLEAEELLADLIDQRGELPEGGLARSLVDLHLADPDRFTRDQLVGQLWLLSVSSSPAGRDQPAAASSPSVSRVCSHRRYSWTKVAPAALTIGCTSAKQSQPPATRQSPAWPRRAWRSAAAASMARRMRT